MQTATRRIESENRRQGRKLNDKPDQFRQRKSKLNKSEIPEKANKPEESTLDKLKENFRYRNATWYNRPKPRYRFTKPSDFIQKLSDVKFSKESRPAITGRVSTIPQKENGDLADQELS